ncbi:alanine racemase [Phocea massiliensis]|uniref:Alanine racemase n=1 Tax=uncultured Anaerotruncus sp. TaxID=905011 RepID=A0A6N2V116_9FIRM|nr:alanine racemase [uncultured Merdimmobilis sp.]MCD4836910.1 alanine racemase [Merdimmobilis hominis]PWL61705.1 MAG: alanine racemase [Oscillospiraceae bacterium]
MREFLKRSWATIDLDAIGRNIAAVRARLAPGCRLMAVVKADAYGHGDRFVATAMARAGVDWFGVSNIDEAVSLRRHGICHPTLIFGPTPVQMAGLLSRYNITQMIPSLEYARSLQEIAQASEDVLEVHIKLDTGMSRLGFLAYGEDLNRSLDEIGEIAKMPNLSITGTFTHFAVADEDDPESVAFTKLQFQRFQEALSQLEERGIPTGIRHCCNSAGVINYPEMHLDMVRPGVILYGLSPSADCQGRMPLSPAMSLYSTLTLVKTVAAGTTLSYGRIFTAPHKMRVGTVSIGYADGFERNLSGKAKVLIRGKFAPVIGRVCMDQLMVDLTDIPDAQELDLVTVVGQDGENAISFDDFAALSDTVNYEKICLVGKRVPRVYRKGGMDIGVAEYLKKDFDL